MEGVQSLLKLLKLTRLFLIFFPESFLLWPPALSPASLTSWAWWNGQGPGDEWKILSVVAYDGIWYHAKYQSIVVTSKLTGKCYKIGLVSTDYAWCWNLGLESALKSGATGGDSATPDFERSRGEMIKRTAFQFSRLIRVILETGFQWFL